MLFYREAGVFSFIELSTARLCSPKEMCFYGGEKGRVSQTALTTEKKTRRILTTEKETREHKRDDLLSALSAPHNNALIGTEGISQVMSINPTKTKWQFIYFIHFILLQTPICLTFLSTLSFYLKIKKKSVFSCGSCGNPLCTQLFPSIHSESRIDDSAAVKMAPKDATSCWLTPVPNVAFPIGGLLHRSVVQHCPEHFVTCILSPVWIAVALNIFCILVQARSTLCEQ